MWKTSLVLFAVVGHLSNALSTTQPTASIEQGLLTGIYQRTANNRLISAFHGIPYARPPTADLRFEAPVLPSKWAGVLNATIPPPACLQYSHLTYKYQYCPVTGTEDCLYLNVFTPKLFDGSEQKPMDVIVYIHPGSWSYFSSVLQGPQILLDRDVVFVTFNFRLGPLGFLSTGDHVVPGNNGLKDQVLALKWVKKNIAAFGGNPESITISGQSSGGASVHYHMLSPLSKGLFRRAISMSGTALSPWALAENVKEKSLGIAKDVGCPTADSKEMIDCMKTRSAHSIVDLSKQYMPWLYNPYSPFGPVIEPQSSGAFLSESPVQIISKGKAAVVPWLVTFVPEEGLYPGAEILGTESYVNDLENRWEELLPFLLDYNYTVSAENFASVAKKIKEHYKIKFDTHEGKMNFIQMLSDRLYMLGMSNSVRLHGRTYNSPIYMYRYSYKGRFSVADELTKFRVKEHYGVCHGDDAVYLMPLQYLSHSPSDDEVAVAGILRDIWAEFSSQGLVNWSPVNKDLPKFSFVSINGPGSVKNEVIDSFGDAQFWNSLPINEEKIPQSKDEL